MSSANETEIFQHYQVLKRADGALWELGRGAMGITYKAFDTNLRCDVALKVINALHLDSETARARFLREARAAAGLRHRNVASVYHLGNDDQSFFYAMEFVDGETVESLVKDIGPMPPADALQIVVQIARALGAAARQGLVHRDIKPANIMVTREDDEEDQFVVKVIDFGLARPALGGEGSAHITMGGFVGTPQFASPEQLEEKDLDARSDIYSLGVTLWFMLAGKPPFTGPLGSVFIQQLTKEPPWAQLEGTPEPVRALLAGMLEKEPDKRPQTPVELRRRVEACLRELPASDRLRASPGFAGGETMADSLTGTEAPVTRVVSWGVGSVLDGRFELVELAGEGSHGRVFRARDREQAENGGGGRPVTVKILHGDVLGSAAERRRVEGELEKLRGAPHPCLLAYQELRETAEISYLVGEWVNGFTLVDLLRRRGQLPLPEALRLVAQAALVADHARAHDLRRLELSVHQVMTAFAETPGTPLDPRAALTSPLEEWPPFALKFDALGITREAGDSVTWAGDQTMMPAAALGRDTQTSIRGFVEGSDLFALGQMTYELLNGAPPAHGPRGGREARYVALPALNEPANMILRRALSPNPGFGSNVEFFRALVGASGLPETYLEAWEGEAEADPFAVERLPVSGTGAEDAGATLVLEDGESLPLAGGAVALRGPSAAERAEAEREQARVEREAARRAEAQRIRAGRAEAKRVAEAERIGAERAAAERLEAARIEAQRAEARRIEAQRIEAERLESERLESERAEAQRVENERLAAERAEAKLREQAEKAAAERLAAERAETKRLENERLAAERAEAKRREQAQKAAAERLAAERAEAKRLENERLAAEQAEAKRLETERLQAERVEAERIKRLEAEKLKAAKVEAERVKAEKIEAKRLEAERIKAEKAEAKRLQAEQAQAQRQLAAAFPSSDAAASPATARKKKMLAGIAAGVVLLGIIGAVALNRGNRPETPVPVKAQSVETTQVPVEAEAPRPPEPPPQTTAAAIVEATPAPEPSVAVVEPTPAPAMGAPEASSTPVLAEATPEPVIKKERPDNPGEDRRTVRADRAAKAAAEEKKRAADNAEAARERALAKERDRENARRASAAAAEPKKPTPPKPRVVVAEKPKPTPEPANPRPDALRFSPLR